MNLTNLAGISRFRQETAPIPKRKATLEALNPADNQLQGVFRLLIFDFLVVLYDQGREDQRLAA